MLRLKELRMEKNLNMRQMAEKLNIAYTTYVNYEKEIREPNSEMLILLADFFGVTIDYLIGRAENPNELYSPSAKEHNLSADEKRLLRKYNSLNIIGKDKIQDYASDLIDNEKYSVRDNQQSRLERLLEEMKNM